MTFSSAKATESESDEAVAVSATNRTGRIAKSLAVPNADKITDLDFVYAVSRGLPIKAAESIGNWLNVGYDEAAKVIVSESTFRRAQAKRRFSPEISDRLYDLARVIDTAQLAFRDSALVSRFLNTPNLMLKNKTPLEVARLSRAGADVVVRLLDEARAGVAV